MRSLLVAVVVVAALPSGEGPAAAQVVLAAEIPAAVPVSQPQSDRFGIGGMPAVGAYIEPLPGLMTGLRGRIGALSDAEAMEPTLANPGAGGFASAGLALRLRPDRWVDQARGQSRGQSRGLFAEAAGGLAITGRELRPTYELAVGWRFDLGPVSAGPSARYLYLHQSAHPIDSRAAHIALIGVDFGRAQPRPERLPRVAVAPAPAPRPAERRPPPLLVELDRDRLTDQASACPVMAPQDDAGCSLPHDLVVTGDRIILEERVLFDDNRARVKTRARPVLRSIAAAWRGHPEWQSIRIEGHADRRGPEEYNDWLSEERARRVREALIELGIPDDALSIEGFGESVPLVDENSMAAFERNRRVEFVIITGPARTAQEEVTP